MSDTIEADDVLQPFEAEVGRVLNLVINSLYKDREIFLRELISNASDACDKLRYEGLTDGGRTTGDFEILVTLDPNARTVSVQDNGIGMDRDDLEANLGTVARSGTARFLEAAAGDKKADLGLIGQFGVGFYATFMVADRVVVRSRKAGSDRGHVWSSDGKSGFSIKEDQEPLQGGTQVELHLKSDMDDFLSEYRVREVVRRYSDHIAFPIKLKAIKKAGDTATEESEPEQVNKASAIWTRSKSEITDEQYTEFYRHSAHAFDDPFARVHFTAEGTLSYTALLFAPSRRPFDLFDPKRSHGVKLFVKRVFIADDVESLLPRYLRFTAGVVDSEDLELNVSRETLQHGAVIARIRKVIVKRMLDELTRLSKIEPSESEAAEKPAEEDGETIDIATASDYQAFWGEFGAVLKEGLYEDHENRDKLLGLLRARSTRGEGWVSLADYVANMREGQEAIYYISGESAESLRNSPQLEIASAKGVEVLLFDDPVDEFWLPEIAEFEGKKLVSLTKGDVDLSGIADVEERTEEPLPEGHEKLIARIKLALGDAVKDVRPSKRLRDSAVCLVADDAGMDMRMERFLKQHNQLASLGQRVLEVNTRHDLLQRMAGLSENEAKAAEFDDLSLLLLDQARIVEGEPIPDPGAFSRRMSRYLAQAVG